MTTDTQPVTRDELVAALRMPCDTSRLHIAIGRASRDSWQCLSCAAYVTTPRQPHPFRHHDNCCWLTIRVLLARIDAEEADRDH